ncbi:MAG: polysaccharide deacetylase family protein [Eubacteriales bacterium]
MRSSIRAALRRTVSALLCAAMIAGAPGVLASCAVTAMTEPHETAVGIPEGPLTQPAGSPVEEASADTSAEISDAAEQTTSENAGETADTAQSGAAAQITEAADKIDSPVTPVQLYTDIPDFWNEKLETVKGYLDDAKITYTVEEEYSTAAEGLVSTIVYYGYRDENGYHLRVGKPVVLRVSLGAEPAALRSVENYTDDDVIYLTFDDGPSKNVDRVLEILDKYGIKATFFLVGNFVAWRSEDVRKIYEAGHTIGCHSMSHDIKTMYLAADAFTAELDEWEDAMKNAVGDDFQSHIFRFPGGSNANRVVKSGLIAEFTKILGTRGYNAFDWTFANNDKYPGGRGADEANADYLTRSVGDTLTSVEKRSGVPKIMLMHDTEDDTVDTLEWTIEYLVSRGYKFSTLDTLDGSVMF